MDDIARWPATDRADLFREAAALRGDLRAEVIEKDFWVCWILRRVFTLPSPPAGLIFKGGTSLSKVYRAIERFSEDVDLSFDRSAFGFGGDSDPGAAPSNKQVQKRLDALAQACRTLISGEFRQMLAAAIADRLGEASGPGTWELIPDPDDPDGQTLLFRYPQAVYRPATGLHVTVAMPPAAAQPQRPIYLQPTVRLEMGARGEQWPAQDGMIMPYAADAIPSAFKDPTTVVNSLVAERTFWEKATVLHACCHCPEGKPLRPRLSRHFYDVVRLYEAGIGKRALADLGLLRKVAEHQAIFFRSSWSRYEEAVPPTLRLVPPDSRRKGEMIFGEPPPFEHVLAVLAEIEGTVNK